jgi:antitoxin (DNA-binding transcriptional repressor) of toxin-antitoxin stability system
VEITERGRPVVNLRVPISLGRAAISQVPGISEITSERIREAIAAGIKGPILEVDDDGDGVRISIE